MQDGTHNMEEDVTAGEWRETPGRGAGTVVEDVASSASYSRSGHVADIGFKGDVAALTSQIF